MKALPPLSSDLAHRFSDNTTSDTSHQTMNSSDRELIEAFQEGDEFAFVSLYDRYKTPVYAFCCKMLLDRTLAQDVMQETFLRVYENRGRLANTRSFRAWVFTIARNQCLNQIRKNRRQVQLDEAKDVAEPLPETPVLRMEKSERIALVNHFLGRLKPDYREVIVLREYQNLSYDEIAAVTRSTLSAVKSRLFKARRKLAAYMEPVLRAEEEALRHAAREVEHSHGTQRQKT